MKVFIERKNVTVQKKFEGKAIDLLKELRINKEEVIVIKNNSLTTLDSKLKNSDDIKILSVISGG